MLCARFGSRWGFRLLPLTCLPAAGLLLLVAVNLNNPYMAVIALAASYAMVEINEGAFWGAAMFVARSDTMSATGIMNTGGNIGGLIAIPIVGYLSAGGHWTAAFAIGTAFAIVGAVTWLGIDADKIIAD
jgi:MFS transporter, ACS family, glucarate transporter